MSSETDPIVGNWYRHPEKSQVFQVVAVDEDGGFVEVQNFDGDLEELDLDAWYQLDIETTEEPENWSGALDVAELDDLTGTEVTDTDAEDWVEPLYAGHDTAERPSPDSWEEADTWGRRYPSEAPLDEESLAAPPEETEED